MKKKGQTPVPREGFRYQADVLPPDEERDLVEQIRELPLKEFEFHNYVGKRRVLSYGWHYDFADRTLRPADEIPMFLHKLRERAAAFADLAARDLPHALVTEFGPPAYMHTVPSTNQPVGNVWEQNVYIRGMLSSRLET